jgi:hypothetical protein
MRRASTWPAVAAISALAAVGAVAADFGTPVRGPLVVWFLLVGPGLTVVGLLGFADPWLELAASVAISMALGVAVAEAMLFLGLWSPTLGLLVLAALTLAGAAFSATRPSDSPALSAVDRL